MIRLDVRHESFPIAGTFTISRGSKTAADVVVVELRDGDAVGRGECVPYARYDETLDSVIAQVRGGRLFLARRSSACSSGITL